MNGTPALQAKIKEEAEKLQALLRQREGVDRQIELIRNRLEAFQQALSLVTGTPAGSETSVQFPWTSSRPVIHHADPWEDALLAMRRRNGEFTTDDILAEATLRGSDIDRAKARSRLAHLVDRRVLKRVREGVFEFSGDAAA